MSIGNLSSIAASSLENSKSKEKIKETSSSDTQVSKDLTLAHSKVSALEGGVIFEQSPKTKSTSNDYDKAAITQQMKLDAQNRISQFKSLVENMFKEQGVKIDYGTDGFWKTLAKGEFTVTAEQKEQATAAIAEDGYWGVEQTSDRILEFAKSLSGGDSTKADELLDAFKEGFSQATGAWGKELPDISKKTYDAVVKKFEEWKAQPTS